MAQDGASGDAAGLRTFEEAKSTLYGTISAAGAALDKASRRRESTVTSVAAYLDRIQLDLSSLSVIHVTGTKGKGSTCAMIESVLRHHGFKTGLYTSPHLLEVTERVRCEGKPLTKEAFARYFFQERVDVCVLEVGMGGRFDATNVVPSPVVCGVAMLDLDHTQVLGDTLDKIAWEKGGIFKEGCRAMTVEQPRGGMSVLRECARKAGCGELEVVKPLPARDASGRAYKIGLAGEHQRVNAGLALRMCAVWLEARQRQHPAPLSGETGDADEFRGSEGVHRGLSECVWPGRCQVFRSPKFPSVTVYLDGAHTEQSIHACLEWFIEKTARAADDVYGIAPTPAGSTSAVGAAVAPTPDAVPLPQHPGQRRRRRVLWFNASHERDVVPLLGTLASARRRAPCRSNTSSTSTSTSVNKDQAGGAPLFDEAWFMEVDSARPSRFAPPTAQEILAPHGMSPAVASVVGPEAEGAAVVDDLSSPSCDLPAELKYTACRKEPPDTALLGSREEKEEKASAETGAGAWQRTLQQVWSSLQTRTGGRLSETLTGTAPEFLEKMTLMSTTSQRAAVAAGPVVGNAPFPGGIATLTAHAAHDDIRLRREADAPGVGGGVGVGEVELEVLCTGSLYTIAAALEAFGAQVE